MKRVISVDPELPPGAAAAVALHELVHYFGRSPLEEYSRIDLRKSLDDCVRQIFLSRGNEVDAYSAQIGFQIRTQRSLDFLLRPARRLFGDRGELLGGEQGRAARADFIMGIKLEKELAIATYHLVLEGRHNMLGARINKLEALLSLRTSPVPREDPGGKEAEDEKAADLEFLKTVHQDSRAAALAARIERDGKEAQADREAEIRLGAKRAQRIIEQLQQARSERAEVEKAYQTHFHARIDQPKENQP